MANNEWLMQNEPRRRRKGWVRHAAGRQWPQRMRCYCETRTVLLTLLHGLRLASDRLMNIHTDFQAGSPSSFNPSADKIPPTVAVPT